VREEGGRVERGRRERLLGSQCWLVGRLGRGLPAWIRYSSGNGVGMSGMGVAVWRDGMRA